MNHGIARRVAFGVLTLLLIGCVLLECFLLIMRFSRGMDYQTSLNYLGDLARYQIASLNGNLAQSEPLQAQIRAEADPSWEPDEPGSTLAPLVKVELKSTGELSLEEAQESPAWDDLLNG